MVAYAIAFGMTTAALVRPARTSSLNQSLSYSETQFGSIEQRREWWLLGWSMISIVLPRLMIAPLTASCQIEEVRICWKSATKPAHGHALDHITRVFRRLFAPLRLLCPQRQLQYLLRGRT